MFCLHIFMVVTVKRAKEKFFFFFTSYIYINNSSIDRATEFNFAKYQNRHRLQKNAFRFGLIKIKKHPH